jgi:hypothetical protein
MFGYGSLRRWRSALALGTFACIALSALPAQAAPWDGRRTNFASPRFDYREVYKQSPNGLRQVQYFDKARMEINDPANTSGPLLGVTNGLLAVEMVSGRIKLGDGIGDDENQRTFAPEIPVAGDIDGVPNALTPTYASFQPYATTDNGYRDPNKVGQRADTFFTQSQGVVGSDPRFTRQPGNEIVRYDAVTGHNIPRVFEDFQNAGLVPALIAFGHPITDPYWIEATVAGRAQLVMVQLFERRTLTYTPANPAEYQVEMGNVGQHYFLWRYSGMGTPWATPDPKVPVYFASKRDGDSFGIYTQDPDDTAATTIFRALDVDLIPSSVARTWSDISPFVFGEFRNAQNKRVLMNVTVGARQPNLMSEQDVNSYEPAVSPDYQQLLFVSDRDGNPDIYLAPNTYSISQAVAVTSTENCSNGHPSWLPDGSGFVYETNCFDGNWNVYVAELRYRVVVGADMGAYPLGEIATYRRLTTNGADDRWPRVSPAGEQVVFMSIRDGNTEIYTVSLDGQRELRLTNDAARDEGPAWTSDGRIVFNSNRDGDHELFVMGSGGEGLRQLTSNTVDDGYAVGGN